MPSNSEAETIQNHRSDPAFTVAICTRNRAHALGRTLASIRGGAMPHANWDLIVVDNGSEDDTADVVGHFAESLPLSILREDRPGLSMARNTAVAHCRGRYLIWLDDDTLVTHGWMRAYADAFHRFPQAAFFGGAIHPLFEPPAPPWLQCGQSIVATAFAGRDAPDGWARIDDPLGELPFGSNMAVRLSEQRCHLFDPGLGKGSGKLVLGEETAVLRRILNDGAFGVWVPDADVHHVMGPERQTTSYLWRYYVCVGELRAATSSPRRKSRSGALKYLPRLAARLLAYPILRATASPQRWLRNLKRTAIAIGELRARARKA